MMWCYDWHAYYSVGSETDPTGPSSGVFRVRRGSYWSISGVFLRCATGAGTLRRIGSITSASGSAGQPIEHPAWRRCGPVGPHLIPAVSRSILNFLKICIDNRSHHCSTGGLVKASRVGSLHDLCRSQSCLG